MKKKIKKVCDCLTNCGDDPDIEKGLVEGCNLYKRIKMMQALHARLRNIKNFEPFTKSELIDFLKNIQKYI